MLTNLQSTYRAEINGTFTSLVLHATGTVSIYRFITTSAELPPASFYQAFDVVTSVNGPLTWSKRPDLVAHNLAKMVKPGGLLFVHIGHNVHTQRSVETQIYDMYPNAIATQYIVNPMDGSDFHFYLTVRSE